MAGIIVCWLLWVIGFLLVDTAWQWSVQYCFPLHCSCPPLFGATRVCRRNSAVVMISVKTAWRRSMEKISGKLWGKETELTTIASTMRWVLISAKNRCQNNRQLIVIAIDNTCSTAKQIAIYRFYSACQQITIYLKSCQIKRKICKNVLHSHCFLSQNACFYFPNA